MSLKTDMGIKRQIKPFIKRNSATEIILVMLSILIFSGNGTLEKIVAESLHLFSVRCFVFQTRLLPFPFLFLCSEHQQSLNHGGSGKISFINLH